MTISGTFTISGQRKVRPYSRITTGPLPYRSEPLNCSFIRPYCTFYGRKVLVHLMPHSASLLHDRHHYLASHPSQHCSINLNYFVLSPSSPQLSRTTSTSSGSDSLSSCLGDGCVVVPATPLYFVVVPGAVVLLNTP